MNTSALIIGNWKMNPAKEGDAVKLLKGIRSKFGKSPKGIRVAVAAPHVFLGSAVRELKGSQITLCAQDVSFFENGAHTGEVSAIQLKNIGVLYSIIGHSERRGMGETDETINKKIQNALKAGITPVVCVGEESRDTTGAFFAIVGEQIKKALVGVPKAAFSRIVIAYEPVWALSTTAVRHDATPEDSREMALYIRKILADISTPKIAATVQIIYGGSVNSDNAKDFLMHGGVTGLLPGRASLDKNEFTKIIMAAKEIKI